MHIGVICSAKTAMKHLVLLCGIYYPNPSATGICADRYVSLLKDEYTIDVIYLSSDTADLRPHTYCGRSLYPQVNWRMYYEQLARNKRVKKSNYLTKECLQIEELVLKALGRLQTYIYYPNNLRWFCKKAYRQLEQIHQTNPIDVVFSVSSPYVAHLAASAFKHKHPEVLWAGYTVDPYSANNVILPFYINQKVATKCEAACLSRTDICFLSEELIEYRSDLCTQIKSKIEPLPYLLPNRILRKTENQKRHLTPGGINLVYAGSFYRKIRNPEYLVKVISQINDPKIVLHLYTSGDCEDILRKYTDKSNGHICLHNMVSHDEILQIYSEADIFVSVENQQAEYSPSKVFEYIATGKPILNVTSGKTTHTILQRYPLLCKIDPNVDVSDAVEYCQNFCRESLGKQLTIEAIENIYKENCAFYVKNILHNYIY